MGDKVYKPSQYNVPSDFPTGYNPLVDHNVWPYMTFYKSNDANLIWAHEMVY